MLNRITEVRKAFSDHAPGFGLIQLMVAVAILTILVTATIPIYKGVSLRAYLAEVRYQSKAWKALAWGYFVEHGTWAGASDAAIGWDNPTSRWWDYGPHQYGPSGAPQESWFVANLKPGILAEGVAFAKNNYPDYTLVINHNGTSGAVVECGNLPLLKSCDGILPEATPPAAPTDLSVTSTSSDFLQIAWMDNATDEQGYTVQWMKTGSSSWTAAQLPADSTSYTITGLQPSTTYDIQVVAFNQAGSSASGTVQGTTQQAFLFYDDFNLPDGSSLDSSKWETVILNRIPYTAIPVTIKNGQAWREAPYAQEISIYRARGVSASDYEVSARFSMIYGRSTTYAQWREGIAVRLQDASNYYAVVLRWGHWDGLGVNMYIFKVAGGSEYLLAGPVSTGLSYLGFSGAELKVTVRGNRIQAWLNGALKFDVTDSSIQVGGAGLYMMNSVGDSPYAHFYMDDFAVRSAP